MTGRQLANKWLKTEVLLQDSRIAAHIPQTKMYTAANLEKMLQRFGMVVIKPIRGGGGYGVIRVKLSAGIYTFTNLQKNHIYRSYNLMIKALNKVKVNRPYIIQQGIHLSTIGGRPLDYRVKVVKENGVWETRAVVGRLARPGLFVTNLCKGGTMLQGRTALQQSLPKHMVQKKRTEMRNLTRICTGLLENKFPGLGQLGFDYGIDRKGRVWIFEVNTRPQ
ncbi:glutathione synthase/RimK-type ligase-like ATP-grasp enzyme [Paenibacillus shirakamiensis]|uniref:Glutathione synthase/RimK-type ligase-like ATP-grasp enzyme n=1 Tax=Paenibacillus shirakamiensis TaxID=1265935 RepID=A0ABS4JLV3_9BACL|nr:YheC/YheD family protein [Paenibacillus shirakamiensis]MBP2002081.1 glutathione synthase/RimK-type ligase-like ATP-grasp enzyme [Paenibacillus shirakamiensis]